MTRSRATRADRLGGWRRRLRALFHRNATDHEMSAELAFHLDMETEKNIRDGLDPISARRAAVVAFGGVDRFSEDVRDVRNISWHARSDARLGSQPPPSPRSASASGPTPRCFRSCTPSSSRRSHTRNQTASCECGKVVGRSASSAVPFHLERSWIFERGVARSSEWQCTASVTS